MKKTLPIFDPAAFIRGLRLPFSAVGFLWTNRGLKRYAVLPLIFNIVIYCLAIAVFLYFLWNWNVYHVEWEFLGPVGRWLSAAVNWLGWLVKLAVAAVALAAAFFTFTAVGMALASPLNDILSEKAEMARLGGSVKMAMPFRFTTKAALLSIGDSLRNLVKQLFFTVIVLPFLLIPVVGFVPLFLVGGYFAGFGFLDSAMARNFLRAKHKRVFSAAHFWEIAGFGAAMQAMFAVPFLGMLLMPVGVVAGTLLYCGEDWETLLAGAGLPNPPGFIPPRKSADSATPPEKPS